MRIFLFLRRGLQISLICDMWRGSGSVSLSALKPLIKCGNHFLSRLSRVALSPCMSMKVWAQRGLWFQKRLLFVYLLVCGVTKKKHRIDSKQTYLMFSEIKNERQNNMLLLFPLWLNGRMAPLNLVRVPFQFPSEQTTGCPQNQNQPQVRLYFFFSPIGFTVAPSSTRLLFKAWHLN